MLRSAVVVVFLLGVVAAHAQQTPEEYLLQQEQLKRARLTGMLDSAVILMGNGDYRMADEKFRYVLANIKAVPSDLAFHFGKNSYYLGLYKQSVDWLNKYIQLKGTRGQFSEEAVSFIKKSETEILKQQAEERTRAQQTEVLSSDYEIDCGPTGKVICPVCFGEHVIIKRGAFGNEYKTCPFCNEHGILTCEEYNLLIKGNLKPKF
jgi:hypothetical protein